MSFMSLCFGLPVVFSGIDEMAFGNDTQPHGVESK